MICPKNTFASKTKKYICFYFIFFLDCFCFVLFSHVSLSFVLYFMVLYPVWFSFFSTLYFCYCFFRITTFRSLFESQFAAIGIDEETTQPTHSGLQKESQSIYKFYATGRRYCSGILATLDLCKRHDAFSWILAMFDLSTTQDTVVCKHKQHTNKQQHKYTRVLYALYILAIKLFIHRTFFVCLCVFVLCCLCFLFCLPRLYFYSYFPFYFSTILQNTLPIDLRNTIR